MKNSYPAGALRAPKRRPSLSLLSLAALLALGACASHGGGNSADSGQAPAPPPTGTIGPNTLNVADAAIAGGDPSMALSVSQSILATDPNNVDALVHEGDAYYALDRCPASEAAYQLALKYDPKSSLAETGLGRCELKVDPAAAAAAFTAAVADDPGNGNALNDLGVALDLEGNFAAAVDPYQRALMADPSLTGAEVNLGLSYALSGQGAEALQYLGPLATGPSATAKIREDYAAALVATGRDDEARQVLAVDLSPDQVNQAMAGFQALIAQGIAQPPPPPAPAPTMPSVQTTAVTTTTEMSPSPPPASPPMPSTAPVPLLPAATPAAPPPEAVSVPPPEAVSVPETPPAPPPVAVVPPPPAPMPAQAAPAPSADADAAYTGPSPIAGAVSSSEAGPMAAAPAPAQPAAPESGAPPPKAAAPVPSPAAIASMPAPTAPASPPPAPPAATPAVAAAPSSPTGGAAVQIAALDSADAAQHEWNLVSAASPDLFAGKAPDVSKVVVKGKTYYRLRVGGFASRADAADFCTKLSATGRPCTPANF